MNQITLTFIMNWLTSKIIFIKTGLLLGVILFFLGCKKEKNSIGMTNSSQLTNYEYFTDTITVKSEVVLMNDNIITSNINLPEIVSSYMLTGAYTDTELGTIAAKGFSQLTLVNQFTELPAAVADSAFLYLNYNYYYGNTAQTQTLNVYKLTEAISSSDTYYSNSPGRAYDPTPIGTATSFNAGTEAENYMTIKITDIAYLQSILDASKNNADFITQIPGIGIFPNNNTDGAILRINGASPNTAFRIYYTQYGQSNSYELRLDVNAKKYFTVEADRSSSDLSSLTTNLDEVSSNAISNKCYIQALTGIKTRISFPYLDKLMEAYPNLVLMDAKLNIADASTPSGAYPVCAGLFLLRTESGSIKQGANGNDFHVQPENTTQTVNTSVLNYLPSTTNSYTFSIRSYLQAIIMGTIPNDPLILSATPNNYSVNRLIFNDFDNIDTPTKLNLYFTTTK